MLLYLLLAVASGAAASDSAARAFERAERRLAENRLDEASALYQQAIAVKPSFKLAYFNLGYALRKTNDLEGAARAYEKYVELDPEDPDGFFGLGESYRRLGQQAKAIAAYEQFIAKETRPSEQRRDRRPRRQVP